MAYLSGITLYPIKSLDAVSVPHARITVGGGLEHDRELALFDSEGRVVNGKRTAKVHGLRATVDWKDGVVALHAPALGQQAQFHLRREQGKLEEWLSAYFGLPVTLKQNAAGGFPDDPAAPGPTVLGQATLAQVAAWYPNLSVPECRARFRANLEIADAPPFWEDRLFGDAGQTVRFAIGGVLLEGTNPCQRCIVPSRGTRTGEQDAGFAAHFQARRAETLPPWANASRFNHFYRLAVNTRVPHTEAGKTLRVGEPVRLL